MPDDFEGVGAASVDAAHFRAVLGHFCTGVTIVTAMVGGQPAGLTAQSFVSLSLEPALVAFAPAKTSKSWPPMRESGAFCVNVLTGKQEEVCRAFAVSGGDKFSSVGWKPGETGSPVLNDVLAWIDCRLEIEHDAGDHTIVVGRVVGLEARSPGTPLVFYRGGFGTFAP